MTRDDGLRAALDALAHYTQHRWNCIYAADLSGTNGDEWQGKNARPCNCGLVAAEAAVRAALAADARTTIDSDNRLVSPCVKCGEFLDRGVHDTAETCDAVRGPCLDPARHHQFQSAAYPAPAWPSADDEAAVEALAIAFNDTATTLDAESYARAILAALHAEPVEAERCPDCHFQIGHRDHCPREAAAHTVEP